MKRASELIGGSGNKGSFYSDGSGFQRRVTHNPGFNKVTYTEHIAFGASIVMSTKAIFQTPLVARVGSNGTESYRRMKRQDFNRITDNDGFDDDPMEGGGDDQQPTRRFSQWMFILFDNNNVEGECTRLFCVLRCIFLFIFEDDLDTVSF